MQVAVCEDHPVFGSWYLSSVFQNSWTRNSTGRPVKTFAFICIQVCSGDEKWITFFTCQLRHVGPAVVPQFETCGREIHKIVSLAMTFTYFFRVFFVVQLFLNSLPGLFTVPLTRMTDLLSRRSFVLFLSIYLFLNSLFGELTKIRAL